MSRWLHTVAESRKAAKPIALCQKLQNFRKLEDGTAPYSEHIIIVSLTIMANQGSSTNLLIVIPVRTKPPDNKSL